MAHVNGKNLAERITEYENGTMDETEACELFQYLVDTGIAWMLQGIYGRTAMRMIQDGLIHA